MERAIELCRRGAAWLSDNAVAVVIGTVLALAFAVSIGSLVPFLSIATGLAVTAVLISVIRQVYSISSDGETVDRGHLRPGDDMREWNQDLPDPSEYPQRVLGAQGFDPLSDGNFTNRTPDEESCWRREFNFSEVAADIPIDRRRPDAEDTTVPEELRELLAEEEGVVLLGRPGSGKTTTTKTVAHRWHEREDTGPVVYRQHRNEPITNPKELATAIEQFAAESTSGPTLVVVEDVVRHQTLPFVEVLHDVEPNEGVCVLLNSRTREWETLTERAERHDGVDTSTKRGREVLETPFRYPERRKMPPLYRDEVARLKERFESVAGRTVPATADELAAAVLGPGSSDDDDDDPRGSHGVSPMLRLVYRFPVHGVASDADQYETALHANVARVYDRINDPEGELREYDVTDDHLTRVALLATVLNAADVPVYEPFLYPVVGDEDELEETIGTLDGTIFFGTEDGEHHSHHPIWSKQYLLQLIDSEGEATAREEFETVVNELFHFLAQREDGHESLSAVVDDVFDLCEEFPPLEPLFTTTAESNVEIPSACSATVRANCTLSRHRIYRTLGKREAAMEELKLSKRLADRAGAGLLGRMVNAVPGPWRSSETRADAVYYTQRGVVAQQQGNYEQAREYHEDSLAIKRELGDRAGEATSLNNLGLVAREQGDYGRAKERHEQAADIFADIGAPRRLLTCYRSLATTCVKDDDEAGTKEACERGLAVIEQIDLSGLEAFALQFQMRRAQVDPSTEATKALYRFGLLLLPQESGGYARDAFREVWQRRDDFDAEASVYDSVLAASVGYAGLLRWVGDEDADHDATDVLETVRPHTERLSDPAATLYTALTDPDAEVDPDTLLERVDDEASDELEREDLERVAYAALLAARDSTEEAGSE